MWDRPSFQDYYGSIDRAIGQKLNQESADYLLRVDFEEYLDYLVSEAEWDTLEWDESQMTIEPFSTKVERPASFDRIRSYVEDVQKFRIRIPVSPHPQLQEYLKLLPSQYRLSGKPQWGFQGNTLILETEPTQTAVDKALDEVRYWFGRRNQDIENGNKTLRERIRPVWERKRKDLEAKHEAARQELEKLNIPLHQDPKAPAKPIEIKPEVVKWNETVGIGNL